MYEKYIEVLEDIDTSSLTTQQVEALEIAKDSMAFITGLNDAFIKNGSIAEQEPNLPVLESMVDSLVCELFAAVMILSNIPGSEDRLRNVYKELMDAKNTGQAEDTDVQAIKGYSKLADRVERSRKRLEALKVT